MECPTEGSQSASDGYGIRFWTMRESPFHQLSDFQCIFLFAFGEVKIICAFVTFSADPMLVIIVLLAV